MWDAARLSTAVHRKNGPRCFLPPLTWVQEGIRVERVWSGVWGARCCTCWGCSYVCFSSCLPHCCNKEKSHKGKGREAIRQKHQQMWRHRHQQVSWTSKIVNCPCFAEQRNSPSRASWRMVQASLLIVTPLSLCRRKSSLQKRIALHGV